MKIKNERKLGKWQLMLVALLVVVLSVTAIMVVLMQTKTKNQGDKVLQQSGLSYYAEKYIDFFEQNDNGTVSLNLNQRTKSGVTIDEQDVETMKQYDSMLNIINKMVDDKKLYIAEDGNYYPVDNTSNRTIVGGKNDFYVRTEKVLFIWVPVGYYFSMSMIVSTVFVTGIDIAVRNLGALKSNDSLMQYLKSIYNDEQVKGLLNGNDANIQKIKETFESLINGKYSQFVQLLGVVPIVGDLISLLITFGMNWLFNNVVPSVKTKVMDNSDLKNPNNTIIITSNLLLGNRQYSAAAK